MNSTEHLKSTQWRKLFKISESSSMQRLNIFGVREGFLFDFTNLSGVWEHENHLTRRAHMSAARFRLNARDGCPVLHAAPCSRWPRSPHGECSAPVAAGRRRSTWLGPPLPLLQTSPRKLSPTPFFPLPHSTVLLTALLCASHCFITVAHHRRAAPICSTGPKGAPRHCAPPAPRACPQHRLVKPGHRTSPPSSSSESTSLAVASSACSPTLSTPQ
jgi:hypothetical protein